MRRTLAALAVVAVAACGGDEASAPTTSGPTFVIQVNGETFKVRASAPAMQATLRAHLANQRIGVLHGRLVAGNGGFNAPMAWHLDPATLSTPDVAVEVCDGRPSDVTGDLSYWIGTVRYYCPWGARVLREEP